MLEALATMPESAWLTKAEAAAYCRVTPRTIERWVQLGLRRGGIGRAMFRQQWLDEWIEQAPERNSRR